MRFKAFFTSFSVIIWIKNKKRLQAKYEVIKAR